MPEFFRDNQSIPVSEDDPLPVAAGLQIPQHDYISNTYTDGNLTEVVYKDGGASGTVVATLTMTYDVDGNLLTVTKT